MISFSMLRVVGLMSGTSVDGIDAALVEITGTTFDLKINLLAGKTYPYPAALRSQILRVCSGDSLSLTELAVLDDAIAHQFAQAAIAIQAGHPPADLIGSHGQTVYHRPLQVAGAWDSGSNGSGSNGSGNDSSGSDSFGNDRSCPLGYSLQLGRGALIAHLTGITTISNFRAADIAAGGQGAPLVPPVDACLLSHPTYNRCIQNIGGIGNVTYLPARPSATAHSPHAAPLGWDTGPGNTLLDLAVQHLSHGQQTYDQNGQWAASGTICQELVKQWLQQDFFQQPPPKSTGRELFGHTYLMQCLEAAKPYNLTSADLLATLTELTAASIVYSYQNFLPHMPHQVLLCGGGSHNLYLRQRLQTHLHPISIQTTDEMGVNADFKEAIAFAVLAYWRNQGIPGNLPEVTGALQAVPLGEIHLARESLRGPISYPARGHFDSALTAPQDHKKV